MMKYNNLVLLSTTLLLLCGCSTPTVSPSTSYLSVGTPENIDIEKEMDENLTETSVDTVNIKDEDVVMTKEELDNGVYLINNGNFIPIPTNRPGISQEAYYIVDPEDSSWLTASPGDTLAFKGSFYPNQEVYIDCSTYDYYSFPNTFNLAMDGGLSINLKDESSSTLAVDSILDNNMSYPDTLVLLNDEEGYSKWYIQNLNWEINSLGWNGYYLNGNFPKGYTVAFSGFQGTNYVELELQATCHIINMPDESFSDQNHHMKSYLETTKDGYFILTIPENIILGYSHFHVPGLNGCDLYLKIE